MKEPDTVSLLLFLRWILYSSKGQSRSRWKCSIGSGGDFWNVLCFGSGRRMLILKFRIMFLGFCARGDDWGLGRWDLISTGWKSTIHIWELNFLNRSVPQQLWNLPLFKSKKIAFSSKGLRTLPPIPGLIPKLSAKNIGSESTSATLWKMFCCNPSSAAGPKFRDSEARGHQRWFAGTSSDPKKKYLKYKN